MSHLAFSHSQRSFSDYNLYPHPQYEIFLGVFSLSRSVIYKIMAEKWLWRRLFWWMVLNDENIRKTFPTTEKLFIPAMEISFYRENFINCFIDFRKEINLFHLFRCELSENFSDKLLFFPNDFLLLVLYHQSRKKNTFESIQEARICTSLDIIINLNKTRHLINPHFYRISAEKKSLNLVRRLNRSINWKVENGRHHSRGFS